MRSDFSLKTYTVFLFPKKVLGPLDSLVKDKKGYISAIFRIFPTYQRIRRGSAIGPLKSRPTMVHAHRHQSRIVLFG